VSAADSIALARQEWEEGYRRLETERGDLRRYHRLVAQVEVVLDELRKRVGQTYTLAELATAYRDADRWAREAVEENAPAPGWPRDLSLVLAAAFHAYQRGALDYAS
jgi:alcohol dehydrogenase class IV